MNLRTQLTTLESSGLIHLAQTQPELEYLFHHALLQDVAYESLLKTDRKRLHLQVGLTLEKLYADHLDEIAPLLANHFDKSDDTARALKYFILSGDAAARVYANAEARQHYRNALNLMRQHIEYHTHLQEVYLKCGRGCEMIGHYDEALITYSEMESVARESGDEKLRLAALIARATVFCAPTSKYDAVKGESLCAESRELAHQLNDRAAEAKILWNLALLNKFKGRWDVSLKYGEEAIAIARELNLRELLAYVLNDIYLVYSVMGRFNAATQALEESSALWRELNNMAMLGDNLSGLANLQLFLGDAKRSIEIADESYRLNLKMHNTWGRSYSAWALGQAHAFTGDITQAIFFLEESIRFGEEVGFRVPPIAARCLLAYIFSRAGQSERGLKVLQEAFEYGQDFMRWLPFVFTVRAQLYVEQGDFTKATEALQHIEAPLEQLAPLMQLFLVIAKCKLMLAQNDWAGIATFIEPIVKRTQQANAVRYSIDYFYYQAQAYIGLGRLAEGRAILIWACQEAQTAQSRVALYPCLLALANLETEPTDKRKWLTQARETILYIADHFPADLRETFLQTADVKHVLESS